MPLQPLTEGAFLFAAAVNSVIFTEGTAALIIDQEFPGIGRMAVSD